MRRPAVLASVLALSLSVPGVAAADPPAGASAAGVDQRLSGEYEYTPRSVSDEPVTVVLELADDPVAVVEAESTGQQIAAQRKSSIRAQLKSKQDALKGSIRKHGGTVLAQYQSAYNGVKVEVAASKVEALRDLPGVVGVREIELVEPDNATAVPYLGVPQVWEDTGYRGENVKVAIIDTGIDYTHAGFGGPGTKEAFEQAEANDTEEANPEWFGPEAPRIKGGWDFAGDDYDANDPASVAQPDPNPLDCHGHGTHVAGSAAGSGVTADGATYTGPYDETVNDVDFRIGPGVAPKADLYALRVFGCGGSTDLTLDAIEWAVANDMDVINMSLGSTFGRADDPSAVASDNAAAAGVVVVTSAGNSGADRYMGGSPGVATRALNVAATDATEEFPGAEIALPGGGTVTAINANGAELPTEPLEVVVLRAADGSVALGCTAEEFAGTDVAGKLVVTQRGACARVARAVHGQEAGAAAVAMVNNTADFPPYEGPITENPDNGEPADVTIPFLGLRGVLGDAPAEDGDLLVAAEGAEVTLTATALENPGFENFASFTSGGPRRVDSALKPDVSAPGVAISSPAVGSGDGAAIMSGTSMAAPFVAGQAALVVQSHPEWDEVVKVKAAIVNTAETSRVENHVISRGGSGLVSVGESVTTQVVATGDEGTASLSFGFQEVRKDFTGSKTVTVHNSSDEEVTYTLGTSAAAGSPHSVDFADGSVTVPAGGSTEVEVELTVPVATIGDASDFREVAGLVTLTPADGGTDLVVPYYMVPRATADVRTVVRGKLDPNEDLQEIEAFVQNKGLVPAVADFFQWGLEDEDDEIVENDLRAVGVQTVDNGDGTRDLLFAVNTWGRWDNAAVAEYNLPIHLDDDDVADYIVVGADLGNITAGSYNGLMASFVWNPTTGMVAPQYVAGYRYDNGTLLLRVSAEAMELTEDSSLFEYGASAFSVRDSAGDDTAEGTARYDVWSPAYSAESVLVGPKSKESATIVADREQVEVQEPLGVMAVVGDNAAGPDEAQLLEIERKAEKPAWMSWLLWLLKLAKGLFPWIP